VAALALVGLFSVALAVLPRSWIVKARRKDREDEQLFLAPLKWLGGFAAISYLLALFAYLAPRRWNLDPQLVLSLCPLYFVKMTFDPSLVTAFFLLAPMKRGGVRITRPHLGIRMVALALTNIKRWLTESAIRSLRIGSSMSMSVMAMLVKLTRHTASNPCVFIDLLYVQP
jgi:hypothetical protein